MSIDSSAPSAKETSAEAMPTNDAAGGIPPQTPTPTPDLLQSIRIGWRDVAAETARNIQRLSQATVEHALEMGQQLLRMQRDLKRKEYSTFLNVLGWASAKARKLINLAKIFADFEPSQLKRIEITTLLSLCSSRYSAIVAQLREVEDITQQLVEQMIKQTKKPRIPKQDPISGWKQNRSGGARRYEVILHDEQTGLSIEQQAEAEAILPHRVIQEAVALRLKSKTDQEGDSAFVVLQALEQQDEQEQISAIREQIEAEAQQQAHSRFEMLEFGLKQQIAYLEAQLAAVKSSEIVKPSTATGLESSERLEVIESPTATGLEPVQAPEATLESSAFTGREDAVASEQVQSTIGLQQSDDEVALASDNLSEDLEIIVASLASIQLTEPECSSTSATDGSQPVAEPSHSQLSDGSATDCQILAADWDLIQQLRHAESSLQKIDTQIQGLNSPFAKSCSNTVVERELKQLRSLQISKIVDLINSNFIPAYYEEQQGFVRVVLDPKYASDFLMQAQSWADVVLVVGSDGKQLRKSLKDWTKESRQLLVRLLSAYLESESSALGQIDWIPEKLLTKTLSLLPFKIRIIGGPDNLVDEPKIEYISCDFVSLEQIGTDREQWIFRDCNNNNHAVFGRDEIEVEKF